MKMFAAIAFACMIVSGLARADAPGSNSHGDHGGGRGQNSGVYVDVPWSAINTGNNTGIPPRSDYEIHCRDVRHSCFGQFGVQEPGYGQCMASRGC
jgi:hypothetical protein